MAPTFDRPLILYISLTEVALAAFLTQADDLLYIYISLPYLQKKWEREGEGPGVEERSERERSGDRQEKPKPGRAKPSVGN